MDNSNRINELQTALTTAIRINEFLMAENDLLRKKDFTPCSKKPPEEDGCYLVYAPNYSGGSSSSKEIHDGVMFSNYKNGKWSIEVGYHKRPGCVEAWMPIPKYKDRNGVK